ncbi:hypothetical protein T484DRAFT_3513472 [Baffinella frigidus]|nr:hypothetical protein T484DRAFT_3513472 [Cryptophyta sp. CCMP2293]
MLLRATALASGRRLDWLRLTLQPIDGRPGAHTRLYSSDVLSVGACRRTLLRAGKSAWFVAVEKAGQDFRWGLVKLGARLFYLEGDRVAGVSAARKEGTWPQARRCRRVCGSGPHVAPRRIYILSHSSRAQPSLFSTLTGGRHRGPHQHAALVVRRAHGGRTLVRWFFRGDHPDRAHLADFAALGDAEQQVALQHIGAVL